MHGYMHVNVCVLCQWSPKFVVRCLLLIDRCLNFVCFFLFFIFALLFEWLDVISSCTFSFLLSGFCCWGPTKGGRWCWMLVLCCMVCFTSTGWRLIVFFFFFSFFVADIAVVFVVAILAQCVINLLLKQNVCFALFYILRILLCFFFFFCFLPGRML